MEKLESEILNEINHLNLHTSMIMDDFKDDIISNNKPSLPISQNQQEQLDQQHQQQQQQHQEQIIANQNSLLLNSINTNFKDSLTHSQASMISQNNNNKKDDEPHLYNSPSDVIKEVVIVENDNEMAKPNNGDLKKDNTLAGIDVTSPTSSITLLPTAKASKFPITLFLGTLQLVLSIVLAALGGLVLARGASLSMSGSGIWSGAICGIAGSLGIISGIRAAQTGFLAMSLVCVASSTLALALTGIGVVRDYNISHLDENIEGAVSAGSGLLFALIIHFLISIFSVYYSALKLCSKPTTMNQHQMLQNIYNHSTLMSQHKVEEYIKSMQLENAVYPNIHRVNLTGGSEKMETMSNREKMSNPWMAPNGMYPPHVQGRPIMLVPAGTGNQISMIPMYPPPPPPLIYPSNLLPPGVLYAPTMQKKSSNRRKRSRSAANANETRLRRKSDSDLIDSGNREKKFVYTGLDRAIADSFLEQQEKTNNSCNNSLLATHLNNSNNTSYNDCRDVHM